MNNTSAHTLSKLQEATQVLQPIKILATIFLALIFAAMCLSVTSVHAETIYRSVGADGKVTYSSLPVPGARESKAIDIESLTPEQRRASLQLRLQEKSLSAQVNAQLQSREKKWKRVDHEIISAQKALADAESALQNGRTPLPGERRGNVGGGSRLTEAYFQRLKNLEAQVKQAKQRLDKAYEARNALK